MTAEAEVKRFRGLDLRRAYDSGSMDADVLLDFYVPVLGCAKQYDRLAGYFSSAALAVAARGIAGLVRNGGSMRIACSPILRQEDIETMHEGSASAWEESVDSVLAAGLTLDELADEIARDHVRALAWMLREQRLDIRIVVPTEHCAYGAGLFHQKVGILRDASGDLVSFSGSVNETASGWTHNIEEFKVFRSWDAAEREFMNHDVELFAKYWHRSSSTSRAIPVPERTRCRLLEWAPDDLDELRLDELRVRRRQKKGARRGFRLRNYQSAAVAAWLDSGCRGILEMATGTGKTKTAVAALERLEQEAGTQVVVITAPYQHIAVQWAEDLDHLGPICLYEEGDWRGALANVRSDVRLGRRRHVYICAVQNTAMTPGFLKLMETLSDGFDRCVLVGDEVHGLGAPEMRKALADFYTHRLGLSATPHRWFDEEGSSVLAEFFGETVYVFSIREALDWRDPDSGDSALCPYKYWPVFITLDAEELIAYQELTERLVRHLGHEDDAQHQEELERLLFRRAAIVKEASQKTVALGDILDRVADFSHGLVYCHSREQVSAAADVLLSRGIKYHRFTGEEGARPDARYGGVSEREHILSSLDRGEIDALIAMKCLDEGVDVPSARVGIILASSGNPREFIQRRGRLLRRAEGKRYAQIYDIVVVPNIDWQDDPRVRAIERRVFAKELQRIDDFAQTAVNELEARAEVLKVLSRLG